jgi:hypothetical protein
VEKDKERREAVKEENKENRDKGGNMRLKSLFLFLLMSFLIFLGFGVNSKAQQLIGDWWVGVYLDNATNAYTHNASLSVSNDTYSVAGIFVENDTTSSIDLTINATLNAEFSNASAPGIAVGIYFNGTLEGGEVRPLGNLTITSDGVINVTAFGNGSSDQVIAAGAIFGNATNATNVLNQGKVFVNATANEGEAVGVGIGGMLLGTYNSTFSGSPVVNLDIGSFNNTGTISVYVESLSTNSSHEIYASGLGGNLGIENSGNLTDTSLNATIGSISNSGNLTVTGVVRGDGKLEVRGVESVVILGNEGNFTGNMTASLGSFVNEAGGRIQVSGESGGKVEAIGLGVYVDYEGGTDSNANGNFTASLSSFRNDGYMQVIGNSTGSDATAYGVFVGMKYFGGAISGSFTGTIDSFVNNGTLEVITNANGTAKSYGVYVGFISDLSISGNLIINSSINSFENYGNMTVSATGGRAQAFGVYAEDVSSFINSGNITVKANAGTTSDSDAYAEGVKIWNPTGSFTNNVSISVIAAGGTYALARGVELSSIDNFTNIGDITVTASETYYANAKGVYADGNIGKFTNNGNITVTATANATDGNAEAAGVKASSIGNFTNIGSISVNAIGGNVEVYGVYADGTGGIDNFVNGLDGSISVSAISDGGNAWAYGVYAWGNFTGRFENNGTIQVRVGTTGNAEGYGVYAGENILGDFINRGNSLRVEVTGANATAFGVYASGNINNATNEGLISVFANATGGNATAAGVHAWQTIGNFTNSGNITVTANATNGEADASGVLAGWPEDSSPITGNIGNFTNERKINVSAYSSEGRANAFGVWAFNGTIDDFKNYGDIQVYAKGNTTGADNDNYAVGVYANTINSFFSNGTVNATSEVENGNAIAYGVAAGGENQGNGTIGIFENAGGIFATTISQAGNATSIGVFAYNGTIGDFTNSRNITANATATGGQAWAFGVDATRNINNFANNGSIISTATGGDAWAYGVSTIDIGSFINNGTIMTTAAGQAAGAFGVAVEGNIGNFTNSRNITANATATNGNAWATVVEAIDIGNFTNSGNITATANATGGNAKAAGVSAYYISSFRNTENINVTVTATGGNAEAYGMGAWDYMDNFTNSGNMVVNATATGGYARVAGVYVESNIGNFTNTQTITAIAESDGDAYAFGVNSGDIGNFTNSGSITATASATGQTANAYGVDASSIGNFTNSGNMTVTATGGNATAYGVYAGGTINNLTNEGLISVSANATGGYADIYGVYAGVIGNFTNSRNITATANVTGGNATAYGVYAGGDIGNFTNVGNLTATANVTGGNARATVVEAIDIGNFTNSGNITANVTANATYGYAMADGMDASSIGNFTNTGNITVTANATATTNVGAEAYGVKASQIGNFTNTGTLIVKSIANGTAEYENFSTSYGIYTSHIENFFNNGTIDVYAESIFSNSNEVVSISAEGVYVYGNGGIGNLTNEGTIKVTANANGEDAYSVAINAFGADLTTLNNFNNTGNLEVYVNSKYQNATINATALKVTDSSNADITNNGTMKVVLNLPSNANMTNVNATVFWIENSNATISNYGNTWVESNVAGLNLRTLYIAGTSNVTLRDKFAITFGAPGVNPETRPIYVGSGSTLNLNNATLIARIYNDDSSRIQLGVPYHLIYNDTGSNVNGTWGGLERGYANPSILVNWYDSNSLGADSAVVFSYQAVAQQDTAPVVGSVGASDIGTTSIIGAILMDASPLLFNIFVQGEKPVMLASSSMSDAGYASLGGPRAGQKGIFWLMPLYTRIEAKDLGFKGNSYGLAMGLGGKLSQRAGLEVFGGYLRNDLDYTVKGADDLNQDNWFGGFNFIYNPRPYIFRLSGLGYKANNDYSGKTGLNYDLRETASYDSQGYKLEAMGGYVFGQKVKLVPQIGLSYSYHSTDSFWTKVPDNPSLKRKIKADDLDVWKVKGLLSVVGETGSGKGLARYYLGAKVEQAISDNDVEALVTVAGTTTKVKRGMADTTYGVNAGLNYIYNKRWNFELSGSADFNADYSSYTGKAILRYSF